MCVQLYSQAVAAGYQMSDLAACGSHDMGHVAAVSQHRHKLVVMLDEAQGYIYMPRDILAAAKRLKLSLIALKP